MNLRIVNKLKSLGTRERGLLNRALEDRKLRLKVIKGLQAKGIGEGVDPDNIAKWIELFLRYLPQVIALILQFI